VVFAYLDRPKKLLMNPLSLNLVAITVFLFTMSALIGPLLHLSPTVPAIAAAGLLGLVTIDTLGWQGRGLTMALDAIAGTSAERRLRVTQHEAGHFLVAHLLEVPISGYTLTAWEAFKQGQNGRGGVQFDDRQLLEQLQQGTISDRLLNRYATIWMAGIAAETLLYGTAEGGDDDRLQLRSILSQLRPAISDISARERWALLQAKTLLESHPETYKQLVEAMEQRLSVAECTQTIVRSIDFEPKE
jgi:hypothetical protein